MNNAEFYEALKIIAPGTELREGLNSILRARTGGLVVIDDSPKVMEIVEGGFQINVPFRAAALYELAKMDGAIILSSDVKRIVMANAHLMPPSAIPSRETGIRHRVAERMARYTGSQVIAISERRSLITIYQGTNRHVADEISYILNKANQAVQTLNKYRVVLKKVLDNLTLLELESVVTVSDVVIAVSRMETVIRIIREIEIYVIQLGSEGRLINIQKNELTVGIEEEGQHLLRDYTKAKKLSVVEKELSQSTSEELLDSQNVSRILGYGGKPNSLDEAVTPRGYRVLCKIPKIPSGVVDNIVRSFGFLPAVMEANIEDLNEVDGIGEVRAKAIQEGIRRLKEEILIG